MRLVAVILLCCTLATAGHGLEIVVDKGQETAQPVIIVPFVDKATISKIDVAEVISFDLSLSGKFIPVARHLLPEFPDTSDGLDYSGWKNFGSSFMVVGMIVNNSTTPELVVELLDVHGENRLGKYSIVVSDTSDKYMRKVGHKISDLIYKKLTGKRGAFSTRLAYVSVQKDKSGKKSFALEISGIDGKDAVVAFRSAKSIFSPAWSPDGKKLSYVSLENDKTQVWTIDLINHKRTKIADFTGNNSAPAWSPDGSALALSLSKDGNPEIYLMPHNGELRRLTNSKGADTEPVWASDNKSIYFLSDRGGTPQIYQKNLPDGIATKVSTFGKYNASPDISANGENLVLLHKTDLGYQIAVQNLANATLNVISNTQMDESPSFAPNGEMVVYATNDSGKGVLTVTDLAGTVHRVYSSSFKDIREPAWSPYLD